MVRSFPDFREHRVVLNSIPAEIFFDAAKGWFQDSFPSKHKRLNTSTVRTATRRYTRLSNGFSRKLRNHAAATALNYFAYNFIKIHRTLRVTDRLWSVEDLVALWEAYEQRRAEREAA
jgi:hypothetical protein